MPPPARPHDEEDADDDELSNPEFDDDEEEELLIADPNLYELHKPWGRREIALAAAVIVAWYAVSISAVVSNKLMLRARRFPHPFTMLLIFAAAKWVLARLALRADVLDVTVARPDVDGSYRNATLVEARVVPEER